MKENKKQSQKKADKKLLENLSKRGFLDTFSLKGGLYTSFATSAYLLSYFAKLRPVMWSCALLGSFLSETFHSTWFLMIHSFGEKFLQLALNVLQKKEEDHNGHQHVEYHEFQPRKEIDIQGYDKEFTALFKSILLIVTLSLFMIILKTAFFRLECFLRPRLIADIREALLRILEDREFVFFVKTPTAIIMDRFDEVIDKIRSVVAFGYVTCVRLVAQVCVFIVGMYFRFPAGNRKFLYQIYAIGVLLFLLFGYYSLKSPYVAKISKLSTKESFMSANLTSQIWDSVYNIVNIKVNGAEISEAKRFHNFQQQSIKVSTTYWWLLNKFRVICTAIGYFIQISLILHIFFKAKGIRESLLQIGVNSINREHSDYRQIVIELLKFAPFISSSTVILHLLDEVLVSFFEFIEEATFITEDVERMSECARFLLKPFKRFSHLKEQLMFGSSPIVENKCECQGEKNAAVSIHYNNLSFSYNNCGKHVFNNVNFKIEKGEKIGIVGTSGAGKSTLLSLTLGLYKSYSGDILLDGENIRDIPNCCLRKKITVIPQTTFLFNRTVYENIAFGDPNATSEQVYQCAQLANAHDFILSLEGGYNFIVGNSGERLSGGQRQRIMIARAFLKGGGMLLVDEATSALDSLTESLINRSMEALFKNRTVITIAHRVNTLKTMDRIIVLDKGSIVEEGGVSELLESRGYFYRYWSNITEAIN